MLRLIFIALIIKILQFPNSSFAQLLHAKEIFTKADTLRGKLSTIRTCYDVIHYNLDIKVNIDKRHIKGENVITFKAVTNFKRLQFDLFDNLSVDAVFYKGKKLKFNRSHHAVFVDFPKTILKGTTDSIKILYSGNPIQATRAPWDGGFDWKKDTNGKPFVATAVQGLGASAWWPCKDHPSDEPDSMLIAVTVPKDLMNISNGRLVKVDSTQGQYKKYYWKITNPINNYNVALNIGDYVHFNEIYNGEKGPLTLDYYILKENDTKENRNHLRESVRNTLEAFEYWFGPYPFYEDGYKIVETAHLGMEHQSAIAYGNKYANGYLGKDNSDSGWGKKWDFIVVHESGHEWFGNNITARDMADMWIHESFTNYSESLYTDYHFGKKAAKEYSFGNQKSILNDKPIQGPYHVNKEGSVDMYMKGGVMLHMVRTIIDDDDKWRQILRELNKEYWHKQVDYNDIVNFICKKSNIDLYKFFELFVKTNEKPILKIGFDDEGNLLAKWQTSVKDFKMPIHIGSKDNLKLVVVTDQMKKINLKGITKENLVVDNFNYYIDFELQ